MASTRTVTIDYRCRSQFFDFHNRSERYAVLICHRRAGKTLACVNDLIKRAMENHRPDAQYAYLAPFYNQAKDIAWGYLKQYAFPLLATAPNESELRVTLKNGASIRLYGAENPDRHRGIYLDGLVLDEYADMRESVWSEVFRPTLTDRQGWVTFIGTPEGKNAFWELWEKAKNDDAWFRRKLPASETGLLPQAELDAAKADMGRDLYAQEFECSFDAAIQGAFYDQLERAKDEKRITRCRLIAV